MPYFTQNREMRRDGVWNFTLGYYSQHGSDLLSVLAPSHRIGIPQNNIPHFRKGLAGRTFSEAQQERARKVTA